MGNCGKGSPGCRLCPSLDVGIFSGLAEREFEALDRCRTTNRYKKKQIVFYEGHPVVGLYCVKSGKIKLYKSNEGGKQQILKIAQGGDVLGHSALFTDTPHMATAEVIEEADICFLDKHGFLSLLRDNPSVSLKLLTQLSRELHHCEGQVLDVAYKSVRVRLAEFLLVLKQSYGVREDGVYRLRIALSREELAQAVGTSVETAVRLLSEFRSEGMIRFEKKAVCIVEPEKLLQYTSHGY